jgi:hypothetical protein
VAEPVVLRLLRRELLQAHREAVANGTIPDLVNELLGDHRGKEIACLLCDRSAGELPYIEVVSPSADPFYIVGCVMCRDCAASMPHLLRVARCLRMLRKMRNRR